MSELHQLLETYADLVPDRPLRVQSFTTGMGHDLRLHGQEDAARELLDRAIVNRVWSWLFGRGIVEPINNMDDLAPRHAPLLHPA